MGRDVDGKRNGMSSVPLHTDVCCCVCTDLFCSVEFVHEGCSKEKVSLLGSSGEAQRWKAGEMKTKSRSPRSNGAKQHIPKNKRLNLFSKSLNPRPKDLTLSTKSCSPMPNGAPFSQNPNKGLVAVALDPCQQFMGRAASGKGKLQCARNVKRKG